MATIIKDDETHPLINIETCPCADVKNENGELIGGVCIVTGKDMGKKDIIYMEKEGNARSLRSTTELINTLRKNDVPFEEQKQLLQFVDGRLRALEQGSSWLNVGAGPAQFGKGKKTSIEKN